MVSQGGVLDRAFEYPALFSLKATKQRSADQGDTKEPVAHLLMYKLSCLNPVFVTAVTLLFPFKC